MTAELSASPVGVTATAGQAFTGAVATFTDANPNATPSDYTVTIDWGDGSTSAGTVTASPGFVVQGSHTFQSAGSYPVTVMIADEDGASATADTTVLWLSARRYRGPLPPDRLDHNEMPPPDPFGCARSGEVSFSACPGLSACRRDSSTHATAAGAAGAAAAR